MGGDKMDESIMQHLKRKYNMLIGESSAEKIKMQLGSAYPLDKEEEMEVKGRDLVTGIPQNILITSEEVRKAWPIRWTSSSRRCASPWSRPPPSLPRTSSTGALSLTGGGALLRGLDNLLREETSLPITVVDDPLSAVVLGSGKALDSLDILREVTID
jgi:rod shape-determining protein MreB and related proteins